MFKKKKGGDQEAQLTCFPPEIANDHLTAGWLQLSVTSFFIFIKHIVKSLLQVMGEETKQCTVGFNNGLFLKNHGRK